MSCDDLTRLAAESKQASKEGNKQTDERTNEACHNITTSTREGTWAKTERGERRRLGSLEQLVSAPPPSSRPLLALHMKQIPWRCHRAHPSQPPLKPFPRYHHFCQSGKSFFRMVSSPRWSTRLDIHAENGIAISTGTLYD